MCSCHQFWCIQLLRACGWPVVGPGADLYGTRLVVEREVADVDVASGREHATRLPVHVTVVVDEDAHLAKVRRQVLGAVWQHRHPHQGTTLHSIETTLLMLAGCIKEFVLYHSPCSAVSSVGFQCVLCHLSTWDFYLGLFLSCIYVFLYVCRFLRCIVWTEINIT